MVLGRFILFDITVPLSHYREAMSCDREIANFLPWKKSPLQYMNSYIERQHKATIFTTEIPKRVNKSLLEFTEVTITVPYCQERASWNDRSPEQPISLLYWSTRTTISLDWRHITDPNTVKEEQIEGTSQFKTYKSITYRMLIAFSSEFDDF